MLGGKPIETMQAFSDVLKTMKPGDLVDVEFRRGETVEKVRVELAAR